MGVTDRDKKLLAIFAGIVLFGGFWFMVLGPKRSAVAAAETSLSEAQVQREVAKAAIATGQVEKKKYKVRYSSVLKLGKAIPDNDDVASLIVQVGAVARESKIGISSLTITEGGPSFSLPSDSTGATPAAGASDATAAPAATTATGGATPQTSVGRTINKAEDGKTAADGDANRATGTDTPDPVTTPPPSATDVAAAAAGLQVASYQLTFSGSFSNLGTFFKRLNDMVTRKGKRVGVTGRLLQLNSVDLAVDEFPNLTAIVSMTGYKLPEGTAVTAGATPAAPAPTGEAAAAPASGSGTDGGAATPPTSSMLPPGWPR